MTQTVTTKLKIRSWEENPYREFDDGRKFARADITLGDPGDELTGESQMLLYYRADGTSSYVAFMHLTGTLDGRSGGLVLQGHGTYDGTTARGEFHVVPGSGTDELAGITGTAESVSTHADYPFMPITLRYTVA